MGSLRHCDIPLYSWMLDFMENPMKMDDRGSPGLWETWNLSRFNLESRNLVYTSRSFKDNNPTGRVCCCDASTDGSTGGWSIKVCLSISLSLYLSLSLSLYLSIYLSISLSIYLCMYLSIFMTICQKWWFRSLVLVVVNSFGSTPLQISLIFINHHLLH